MRSSSPTARPRRGLEEDGLLSGWIAGSGTWASSVLHWAPGGLSGMVPWRGGAPVRPPQPTWAHVRKAGMSRTGTFLVSAFTRRLRSSVNSTTSRSSRIGSSVGMREQKDFTEGRRQRHRLPLLSLRGNVAREGSGPTISWPFYKSFPHAISRGTPPLLAQRGPCWARAGLLLQTLTSSPGLNCLVSGDLPKPLASTDPSPGMLN